MQKLYLEFLTTVNKSIKYFGASPWSMYIHLNVKKKCRRRKNCQLSYAWLKLGFAMTVAIFVSVTFWPEVPYGIPPMTNLALLFLSNYQYVSACDE